MSSRVQTDAFDVKITRDYCFHAQSCLLYSTTVWSKWCFRSAPSAVSTMWHLWNMSVPVFNPSLLYLPLRACSHILPTTVSRPLQPLHDRPVPPELSNVSAPERATPATPSSSAANCSAAGQFEKREPATEPQTQPNTVTKYHFVSALFNFTHYPTEVGL